MFRELKVPNILSDAAHSILTNSIAAINSANSSIIFYWNRFDREVLIQAVIDVGMFINEKRLHTRKYLKPECRQQLYDEVFIKFVESCLKSRKVEIEFYLPGSLRSETLFAKDFQIEGLLAKLVWNLTQVTISDDIYTKARDEKIQAWNTRLDEKELIKKIGRPSEWDIFQADDKDLKGGEKRSFRSESDVSSLSESISSSGLNGFYGPTGSKTTESKFTSGAGDGRSLNKTEYVQARELCNISGLKRKHDFLYSIRKLLKHGKNPKMENRAKKSTVQFDDNDHVQRYPKHANNGHTSQPDVNSYTALDSEKEQRNSNTKKSKETEELTIQIPSNVDKIVLIKDGRKITVEL